MSNKKTNKDKKSDYQNYTPGNLETFVVKSGEDAVWVTADRKVLKLSEIKDDHLVNLIEWVSQFNPNASYLNRLNHEWLTLFKGEAKKRSEIGGAKEAIETLVKVINNLDEKMNDLSAQFRSLSNQRNGYQSNLNELKRKYNLK